MPDLTDALAAISWDRVAWLRLLRRQHRRSYIFGGYAVRAAVNLVLLLWPRLQQVRNMPQIIVERRLRPIRFAFLVTPGDLTELRKVFQLNTVLWGGRYNAVVPAWRRTPSELYGGTTAGELLAGYLNAVEPDFVVHGKANPDALPVPPHRIINIDEMLEKPVLSRAGMSVVPLYRWLYEKEFRFVQRDPYQLIRVTAGRTLSAFAACCFGDFAGAWKGYADAFKELGGVDEPLDESSFERQLTKFISPLTLGAFRIDVSGAHATGYLLLDPNSFVDLLDYWNLRAFGWRVFPVPLPWAASLSKAVHRLLCDHNPPSKPVPQEVTAGYLMKGRSVDGAAFEQFVRQVDPPEGHCVVRTQLPRLWNTSLWQQDRVRRPELSARKDQVEVSAEKRTISFGGLPPEFESWWLGSEFQWANVVKLRSWEVSELAEVFPPNVPSFAEALSASPRRDACWCSREGITVLGSGEGDSYTWSVPTGVAVLEQWLKPRYRVELSSAGLVARRMIQMVGGPEWSRAVCHPEMIKLFGRAASAASRSLPHREFWGGLLKHYRDDVRTAERVLNRWVERGIVAIGLQLKCSECAQANWCSLDGLSARLKCERCLEYYSFPSARPADAVWAIRPLGPFALEGRGHGAFTVAVAIRLFKLLGAQPRTTWAPSLLLSNGSEKLEVDFAMLWQREYSRDQDLVLGECKTFGKFEKKDVEKMRHVARSFPGAVIVFASLKEELTDSEVRLLRSVAKFGRAKWRNPVVVLTSAELGNDWGPPTCWRKGAGVGIAQQCQRPMTLRMLADATQQLRLGLPPGPGWPHAVSTDS